MAYGQTGSGKTFTMCGSTQDYRYRGLIPRCISAIFQAAGARYEQAITVRVSYLEIYNEMMIDLLAATFAPDQATNLSIQEDTRGAVVVKGLMTKICSNEEEALSMFFEGETNRTIAEHSLNKSSSRSHTIFTIHVEMRSIVESTEKILLAKLNLVDLAGSERTKKTGSEGRSLVEATYINKSLSFLEQVVVALGEKQRDHIPYRQSKLTAILKDSIGGNCKTLLIANIYPEVAHLEETISTLKFATRMSRIINEVQVNVKLDPELLLRKYEKEIRDLKQELAMHDTLANRGRINYEQFSSEQQYEVQKTAQKFLDGEIEEIEFSSLREVKELFFAFKNLYRNIPKEMRNKNFVDDRAPLDKKNSSKLAGGIQTKNYDSGVGAEENKFGFGVGKAPKDARPTANIENIVNIPKDDQAGVLSEEKAPAGAKGKEEPRNDRGIREPMVEVDKNQLFLEFKGREGAEISDSITKNVYTLREKKEEAKAVSAEMATLKVEIERVKSDLSYKQEGKNQEEIQEGIIDEEEFHMIKELKELKKRYKGAADHVKEIKSAILMIDQNIRVLKSNLLNKFEEWFIRRYGRTLDETPNTLNPNQLMDPREDDDLHSEEADPEAVAYIKAKKKVNMLQKARKHEKTHK
eukprot:TRINITY_DN7119_c0_g1_i1.p1 TRINITY_DN7119_c0_g1~~TRINITY_DN7119_c0_g1_i1.p1  ORF type:complete len:637 (+),score=183.18 TRINITY_DN7119_c0_g1_i1:353-2263(+)